MAPTRSAFAAAVAARRSPSGTPRGFVEAAQWHQGAMQPDRPVPSGLPEQGDDALGFAEGVAADEVGTVREEPDAFEQAGDFVLRRGMAEDGEGEGRLGDEDVAGDGFERRAGRVPGWRL